MFINVTASQLDKPNRVADEKDKKYHVRYAKYAVSTSSTSASTEFIRNTMMNKSFYKGRDNQWMSEDIETFLKDETGQSRNRIKVVHNIIRPLVEQFRGNANRLELNCQVRSISERIVTRREKALEKQKFYYDLSIEIPAYKEIIKSRKSIGDTMEETEEIFLNNWVDNYVSAMNHLMDYSERLNDFKGKQIKAAENLALSGLFVLQGYEHGGHLMFDVVETEEFIWDRSAKKPDLTDAEYMGRSYYALPTNIYERYQVSPDEAESIENYAKSMSGTTTTNSLNTGFVNYNLGQNAGSPKVPVYDIYWKDMDVSEWGYVESEFGIPELVRINHVKQGAEKPEYTDKDLIDYPKTDKNESIFKGKKKVKMYNDIIRYCTMIPSEILASIESDTQKKEKIADIVLDYGIYEYQEVQLNAPSNAQFPFKCHTWAYIDGEILSPVDDAISPQRFINRVLSATEAQINMSGGSGTVFDMDTIDAQDAKTGKIHRDIKQGKPVYIKTKGRGVPNSIGSYDDTPKAGTYNMFTLISTLKEMVQSTTGVNEPLQGQSTGQDQLVGVTELLIQRGSLMQEPFYKALENVFIQAYQMIATVGKKIYAENEMNLTNAVGEDFAETVVISKDMLNEDFRVFVQRENSDEIQRKQADGLLMTLLQGGFIDNKVFANLFGRAKYDEVLRALRQFAAVKVEAERNAQKQQQALEEQQQIEQDASLQMVADEQARIEQREDTKDAIKMDHEKEVTMDKEILKLMSKQGNNQQQRAV